MKKCNFRSIIKFVSRRILGAKVPIIESIFFNKTEDVEMFVKSGGNVNYTCFVGRSVYVYPLLMAVYFGHYEICDLFIRNGNGDVNYRMDVYPSLLFRDTEHTITNLVSPSCLMKNDLWSCLTPTVLSFVNGDSELLSLCFEYGGSLAPFFRYEKGSFIRYFFSNPKHCTLEICQILIKYGTFQTVESEVTVFREEYDRYFSGDISPNYSKRLIFEALMEYGFTKEDDDEDSDGYSDYSDDEDDDTLPNDDIEVQAKISIDDDNDNDRNLLQPEQEEDQQSFLEKKGRFVRSKSDSLRLFRRSPRILFELSVRTKRKNNLTPLSTSASSSPCDDNVDSVHRQQQEQEQHKDEEAEEEEKNTSKSGYLRPRTRSGSMTPCRFDFFRRFGGNNFKKKRKHKKEDLENVSRKFVEKSIRRRRKAKGSKKLRHKEGDDEDSDSRRNGNKRAKKIQGVLFTWTTGSDC